MRTLTMLRDDSIRGSNIATPTAMTTISSGSRSAMVHRRTTWPVTAGTRPAASASDTWGPSLGELLHGHRHDDDDAEEDRLDARVDLEKVHRVGQDQQEDGAKRHHLDPADAAPQADAGNDGGGDALERELRVDHRLTRPDLRRQRQPRDRGEQRAHDIAEDQDRPG